MTRTLILNLAGAEQAVNVSLEAHFWAGLLQKLGINAYSAEEKEFELIFASVTDEF